MALLFLEDFETDGNGTRYFTSVLEFTDGSADFFTRTDGSNIGSFYSLTGQGGSSYFAGMDLDGEGGPSTVSLTTQQIDIAGFTNLSFSGLFAEDDDGGNQDWDADSYALIEYRLDGGAWTNLLAFAAAGGTNTEPLLDTDFDGVGDGPALSDVFTEYTAAIAGTGTNLELRVTLENLNAGDEDFAFDNLAVNGDVALVLNEVFDDASAFAGEDNFFSDADVSSGFDFFGIHDPSGTNTDFGGDTAPNAAFLARYTGFDGSFVAIMDMDGEGGSDEISLDWTGIDISALTNIEFTGLFAEAFSNDGISDWDADSEVRIEAQIDGGGYVTILAFAAQAGTNTPAAQDTNFDGLGDGPLLTSAAQLFTAGIAGTGALLDLRIVLKDLNAGDEDFAFDSFTIGEVPLAAPAGVTITQSDGSLDISEAGTGDSFEIALDTAPTSDVTVTVSVADGQSVISSDGTVYSTSFDLVFSDTTPQTIFVIAEDDMADEGMHISNISLTVAQPAGDQEYDAFVVADVVANITDNDLGVSLISNIQGSGAASSRVGDVVMIEAIVTADFQNDADTSRNLQGFYVQEEDADSDGDALTSEGIFIYEDATLLTDVNVGDVVQIIGTVVESFGETQIQPSAVTVLSTGAALPTATTVSLSVATDLEAYEGMLVTFDQTLTVSELFNLDRFGEFEVTQGGRETQFVQDNAPDIGGYTAHLEQVAARTLLIDDGLNVSNPDPIRGSDDSLGSDDAFRMGETITGLTGVIGYSFGNYRVQTTIEPDFTNETTPVNPRTEAPDDVGGDVSVASMNVLNYFRTIDVSGASTANGSDPRGADSVAEFVRQTDKLVTAILDIDADVMGLIEIENDFLAGSSGNAVEYLVGQLNAVAGAGTYAWVDPGTQFVGDDAIANAVIYRTAAVDLAAGTTVEILDDSDLAGLGISQTGVFNGSGSNRAVIAVTFTDAVSGESFTITVNHLKSKGSAAPGAGNTDIGDGQANSNQQRLDGVNALNAWLATDPTGSGNTDALLLGDFNAYANEDPIVYLETEDFTDLAERFIGTDAYSYVFDGQVGTLDYILSSDSLNAFVSGATIWHVNADEADALDYNLDSGRNAAIFDGTIAARYSDHDPVIIGLNLDPNVLLFTDVIALNPVDSDDDFTIILNAAMDGNVIEVVNTSAIGDVGATTISVDNLTVEAEFGFNANFTLDSGVANLNLSGSNAADIAGNSGANRLVGSAGNNVIEGLDGNDRLFGRDGDDDIDGGAGDDQLYGGAGGDALDGGAGMDSVYYIDAAAGVTFNVATGGTGGDAAGDSYSNIERFYGSNFDDAITGSANIDVLFGLSGNDTINGEGGNDLLYGGVGVDTLNGGDDADRLFGGVGADILNGDSGDDLLYGQGDNDTINGGAGDDKVFAGGGDDVVDGGDGADFLIGQLGNNTLMGGADDDTFISGVGADVLDGGAGIDRAIYSSSSAAVMIDLAAGTASGGSADGDSFISIENLYGSQFNDVIAGDANDNSLVGLGGDDEINGGAGADRLVGGEGADTLNGGADNDTLIGQNGADMLDGGAGDDRLIGGDGDDFVTGGAGNDLLLGQAGADTFIFDTGHGADRIVDFTQGEDIINFAELSGVDDFADLTITQTGVHVLITSAAGTIAVNSSNAADFTADDFTFDGAPPVAEELDTGLLI
ncbi:MAG: ExeM/NucH family extracellular endonuclease [Hellea sp.]